MKNLHTQISRKVTHMRSKWVQKWSHNRQKTQLEQKRATSIPTAICYTLTTFGFPRVTQKPSRIVKENGPKNNITFTVRQVTNNLKRLPFRLPFFVHFRIFLELWPQRAPVPSQSHEKELKQEPRGCHKLPRRS